MLLLDDNSLQSFVFVVFKLDGISLVTLCLLFVNRTRATVRGKVTSSSPTVSTFIPFYEPYTCPLSTKVGVSLDTTDK